VTRRAVMRRIFISHSCRDDAYAGLVRDALEAKFRADGYEVLLDKTRLEPGDEWRSVLYQWLAECDGAVILLNGDALRSPWVARETTMLLWRRALGAPVRIVPALLGAVRSADGTESWTRELLALEAARIPSKDTGPGEAVELANLVAGSMRDIASLPAEDSPLGIWLRDVADCLRDVPPGRLAQAAQRLRVRDEDWHEVLLPRGQMFVAHQLLARPLDLAIVQAIADLARALPTEWLGRLVSLVRSTWVDVEAARQLIAAPPDPGDESAPDIWIYGVNAELADTLAQYLDRATCCAILGYPVGRLTGVAGEATVDELLAQCEVAIRRALKVSGRRPVDDGDFDARRIKRAFLVLNHDMGAPADLVQVALTLHAQYPKLKLLVACDGPTVPPDTMQAWRFPGFRLLDPPLGLQAEREGDQLSRELAGLYLDLRDRMAGAA
jgi:hypothetical protein